MCACPCLQASLTCSIAPDATIKDGANMGGLEGKEVSEQLVACRELM